MLHTLKERGKKMFVLTNSPFPFVDGGMRYLFQVLLHSLRKINFKGMQ
jgi:hypothetical protein